MVLIMPELEHLHHLFFDNYFSGFLLHNGLRQILLSKKEKETYGEHHRKRERVCRKRIEKNF